MTLPRDRFGRIRFTPPPPDAAWPPVAAWQARHWETWLAQHGWTPDQIAQYLQRDRYRYGFGLRRSAKDAWTWWYLPIPAAVPFHATKTPNVLYGGAAGGGKSHAARWDAYRHCWAVPGCVALIMRRTHQELKRNHMRFVAREADALNRWFGDTVLEWVPTEFELRVRPTGSVLLFGHCQNPGDEERYLSDEYDVYYPDELATFLPEQVLGVASRLRSTKPGLRPRLAATSNPGGAQTLWVRRYFIDRSVTPEENERYRPEDWTFIPARLYDNPYLMDPDGTFATYEDRLYARGELRRRQLLEGDWDALVGQFFPEWSPRLVLSREIPSGTSVDLWMDWGYTQPGVVYWVAPLADGHLHVAREWVFRQRVASDVASEILRLTRERGWTIRRAIADPAMWSRTGSGESLAETFARVGLRLTPGDRERVLGWARLRHWFCDAPDGEPWLTVEPSCVYAIRTIPALVADPTNPEDCDTTGEDHAADAWRYGVMSRPAPARTAPSRRDVPPDSPRAWIDSLTPKPRPAGWVA
jgi:phage terminase large subunit